MSTIEQTVNDALSSAGLSRYSREAAPVVAALVEREQTIVDGLVRTATQAGVVSEERAKQIAVGFGLSVRPEPEPEPVATEADTSGDEGLLTRLVAFARQHGFKG